MKKDKVITLNNNKTKKTNKALTRLSDSLKRQYAYHLLLTNTENKRLEKEIKINYQKKKENIINNSSSDSE